MSSLYKFYHSFQRGWGWGLRRGDHLLNEPRRQYVFISFTYIFFGLEWISGKTRETIFQKYSEENTLSRWASTDGPLTFTEPVFVNVYGARESIPRN